MRISVTLTVLLLALVAAAPLRAQVKKDKEKPVMSSRAILAAMQTEVKTDVFSDAVKFSQFLDYLREKMKSAGKDVRILVDEEAFHDENPETPAMLDFEFRLRNLSPTASVSQVLRQAIKLLPMKSALVIRAGKVDIVPVSRTSKEYMLNQTFNVDFSERPLAAALDEFSELTGVSIVVDGRAKQKMQSAVTARFHDDVALQDAVRMLADMAELKLVYLVTGIYVTTPEHAKEMQKELKDLYEPKVPPARLSFPGLNPVPDPGPGMFEPSPSPLAPPLPPAKQRRLEAAA